MHILINGKIDCKLENRMNGLDFYKIRIVDNDTILYEKRFNSSIYNYTIEKSFELKSNTAIFYVFANKSGKIINTKSCSISLSNDFNRKSIKLESTEGPKEEIIVDFNVVMFKNYLIKKPNEQTTILNNTPNFKLTTSSYIRRNPLDDCFFFADNKNLLFSEFIGREKEITIFDNDNIEIEDIMPEIERHFEREKELIDKEIIDPVNPIIDDYLWSDKIEGILNINQSITENVLNKNKFSSVINQNNTVLSLSGNSYINTEGIALAVNTPKETMEFMPQRHLKTHLLPNKRNDNSPSIKAIIKDNLPSQYTNLHHEIKDTTTYKTIEWKYTFSPFYHGHVDNFIKTLSYKGIEGLLNRSSQIMTNNINFKEAYNPNEGMVFTEYKDLPSNILDFEYGGAYSGYNWELFFHIPMLIASKLSRDQQFDKAQKWYHYIFDPTTADEGGIERFWQFKPFYDEASKGIKTLSELIDNEELINKWEKYPFNPHLIARMRVTAYMKNVVMKYLDNIIAWADMLFRRDSLESINEAVNLYIIAAKILGEKPEIVPSRANPKDQTFNSLNESGLDNLTNAIVEIESLIPSTAKKGCTANNKQLKSLGTMFYFGIPKNEKLLEYWDIISDRLFKIRHSMNIKGIERTLSLFQPPINPGLIVNAAAAGVDIGNVLMDISGGNKPNYRFNYVINKAKQFTEEVRYLGGLLLSALEKKDAEELAILRDSQDLKMLETIKEIKEKQCEENIKRKEALEQSKKGAEERLNYFSTRELTNEYEKEYLGSLDSAIEDIKKQTTTETVAASLAAIPDFKIGSPTTLGTTLGGTNLAKAAMAFASAYSSGVSESNIKGTKANALGGFHRRLDDWQMQKTAAENEIKQIDKEIAASDIRIAIANKELESHKNRIENTKQKIEFMQNKFSSTELYDWHIGEISSVYFQAYQIAYDMAKKAQKCFEYELQEKASYISFGYWNSLKKGLLASEKLIFDLNRLENAYMDANNRDKFELEKHVSLLTINPEALLKLKTDGTADFNIPEYIFDLDYPGHYARRIKSVSITIPSVTGPYTTINCTLRLLNHYIRDDIKFDTDNYYNNIAYVNSSQSIAASSGQNDYGMFELNFRDERYLPFEGCGVVSKWKIELMKDKNLRQFDYNSISDVIINIKYTAKEDAVKKTDIMDMLKNYISQPDKGTVLSRIFSSRIEFSNQWHSFFNPINDENSSMEFEITQNDFPYIARNSRIKIKKIKFFGQFISSDKQPVILTFKSNNISQSKTFDLIKDINSEFHKYTLETVTNSNINADNILLDFYIDELDSPIIFSLTKKISKSEVNDIIMAVEYIIEW